jgi:hypothetical protein
MGLLPMRVTMVRSSPRTPSCPTASLLPDYLDGPPLRMVGAGKVRSKHGNKSSGDPDNMLAREMSHDSALLHHKIS